MADLHHVESALVSLVTQIAYPEGTASPSVAGVPVKVHRGWPIPAQLDKDLKAGKVTVSVYPQAAEKRTTRYAREWQQLSVPEITLAATATENGITFAGTPASPLNAAARVNGIDYIYAVQPGDSLSNIATGLASLIDPDLNATSAGPSITIAGAHKIDARIGGVGKIIREIRRQKRTFQVTCWCATPAARDEAAEAIDIGLADIDYLLLPDGSSGRLLYERSHVMDGSQAEGLYRRDLFYSVEYATTQAQDAAQIVAPLLRMRDAAGAVPQDTVAIEDDGSLLTESGDLLLFDALRAASIRLESGAYMLLENGGRLLLDPAIPHDASLQLELGSFLLLESGARLLLGSIPGATGRITLESGGSLLTEAGMALALDGYFPAIPAVPLFAIRTEMGGRLLAEDSSQLSL
ncbi:hypothetical protein TA3x_000463 [Tundrisphaera sp. TA3]|uniref:hypothetical protein n=1 Tax=Tundrisphaera sp. TA3 TaxID=3435775 RepID=UPI003EC003D7